MPELSHANVVVSAAKRTDDGGAAPRVAVVRVYEVEGRVTPDIALILGPKAVGAWEANLIEDDLGERTVTSNAVRIGLRPFEVKTLKLRLQALSSEGRHVRRTTR
ncbi:MAG: hypothetical protein FJZ90_12635 [Chloroflexi bacterium]|nr:hypothetical protein [Chloroflexota bacterium]